MHLAGTVLAGFAGLAAFASFAGATQLTYAPVNPTFGGNPLNGSYLLGVAQSQGFGFAAKNASPDLSGLDAAIANLSTGLGALNVSPTVGAPIIVIGSPTTPAIPTIPTTP